MNKLKISKRFINISFVLLFSTFLFLLSCGSPLGPIQPEWVAIPDVHTIYNRDFVVDENNRVIFVAGSESGDIADNVAVWIYDKGQCSEYLVNQYEGGGYSQLEYLDGILWI